jgi:hypothetical protein
MNGCAGKSRKQFSGSDAGGASVPSEMHLSSRRSDDR